MKSSVTGGGYGRKKYSKGLPRGLGATRAQTALYGPVERPRGTKVCHHCYGSTSLLTFSPWYRIVSMSLQSSIDHQPMGSLQLRVVALCTLINMLDGFDVLVVAFTAAAIAEDWALTPARLGTLLSAGLVGMTLGSLVLGPVADRFGRRPMVLVCLVMISLGMLLSGLSQGFAQLAASRVLTGLGIGGMLPGINTLVAEFSPLRWRSFTVSLLQAGYPIGATLGGALVALYIDESGWRGVYLAAGLLSAALIPLVWWTLPESLEFLLSRRPSAALQRVNKLLASLGLEPLRHLPPEPLQVGAGRTG